VLQKPKRIIVVRHGESTGNLDEQVRRVIPITQLGIPLCFHF
jgi:broad specificity phosphatase PhoE